MGTLFGFAVGYVVGARAGAAGFDELVEAVQAIRDSQEFQGFLQTLREHSRSTAKTLSDRLLGNGEGAKDDMLARAQARMGK